MEKISLGSGVFLIENLLSKEECEKYIEQSESMGYEDAAIQTKDGPRIYKDVRNNARVIFDDVDLAAFIFDRVRVFLPDVFCDEWKLLGLNERFRFYRYSPGEYFKWHKDGFYYRNDDEVSQLTLIMYLNDDYSGGATEFPWEVVKPKIGRALVFPHLRMHQGGTLASGTK